MPFDQVYVIALSSDPYYSGRIQGAKIRAKYIVDGKKEADALEAEIAKLEVELTVAEEKEARLKSALDLAETTDRTIIEQKKASRE